MLCSPLGPEQPVGPVTDLQATELPGQRVRVSWSPVPGATEYRITVRSIQGEVDTASTPDTHIKVPALGVRLSPPRISFHSCVSTAPSCLLLYSPLNTAESRPVTGSAARCSAPPRSASTPCPISLSMAFTLLHNYKLNPCPPFTLAVTTVYCDLSSHVSIQY